MAIYLFLIKGVLWAWRWFDYAHLPGLTTFIESIKKFKFENKMYYSETNTNIKANSPYKSVLLTKLIPSARSS